MRSRTTQLNKRHKTGRRVCSIIEQEALEADHEFMNGWPSSPHLASPLQQIAVTLCGTLAELRRWPLAAYT